MFTVFTKEIGSPMVATRNDSSAQGTVPFDAAALHRVTRLVFAKPRAFSVVLNGGLDLVLHALRAHGLHREADRLTDATLPLVEAASSSSVMELPAAFARNNGRPTKVVSSRLRNEDLESALAGGFRALGWDDLLPSLATWSPSAARAVEGVELSSDDVSARHDRMSALARRVREFEAEWEVTPSSWNVAVMPVDGRTLKAAARSLGLSIRGEVAADGEVPMAARYANRLGRSMSALALSRLPVALSGHAPGWVVRRALCVLGAVAEAVSLPSGEARLSKHGLRVPFEGSPVPSFGWTPGAWWPVLDAWGSMTRGVQSLLPTSWRLPSADADVAVWALSYATGLVGVASDAGSSRLSDEDWEAHAAGSLDPVWAMRLETVWDLFQSTRVVGSRAPFPSSYGSRSAFSVVDFSDAASLPWLPGADS